MEIQDLLRTIFVYEDMTAMFNVQTNYPDVCKISNFTLFTDQTATEELDSPLIKIIEENKTVMSIKHKRMDMRNIWV